MFVGAVKGGNFRCGPRLVDRKRSVCKKRAKEALGQIGRQQEGMEPV